MLGTYLKKKFGRDKKEDVADSEKFYSPLRIGLHSTIEISTVDWLMMRSLLNPTMVLPTQSLQVLAIGEMQADRDTIYQVYLCDCQDEEFILQLYCTKRDGAEVVTEATLYKQVFNIVPVDEDDWTENLDSLCYNTIELDEQEYAREWSPEYDGKVDFVEFTETVVETDHKTQYTNQYMLYKRTFTSLVGNEESEMLLVGVEETIETAEITMMLGLTTPILNINVQ